MTVSGLSTPPSAHTAPPMIATDATLHVRKMGSRSRPRTIRSPGRAVKSTASTPIVPNRPAISGRRGSSQVAAT